VNPGPFVGVRLKSVTDRPYRRHRADTWGRKMNQTKPLEGRQNGVDVISAGKVFHTFAAVTGQARSLTMMCFDHRTISSDVI